MFVCQPIRKAVTINVIRVDYAKDPAWEYSLQLINDNFETVSEIYFSVDDLESLQLEIKSLLE